VPTVNYENVNVCKKAILSIIDIYKTHLVKYIPLNPSTYT